MRSLLRVRQNPWLALYPSRSPVPGGCRARSKANLRSGEVLRAVTARRNGRLGIVPLHALLDTHALLWWLLDDPALTKPARRIIADRKNAVVVSAASAWELATKVRLGKLPGAEDCRGI